MFLRFLLEFIFYTFLIYGILSLVNDILAQKSYQRISHNVKLILTVKNVENGIESYIRELNFRKNFYNNLVVVDMESTDGTREILENLEKDCLNIKVLNKEEGKKYIEESIN